MIDSLYSSPKSSRKTASVTLGRLAARGRTGLPVSGYELRVPLQDDLFRGYDDLVPLIFFALILSMAASAASDIVENIVLGMMEGWDPILIEKGADLLFG